MAKKMYVEGGVKTKTVPGVSVPNKGPWGGSKAKAAQPCCRVNGLKSLYVKRPHTVG